MLNCKDTFNFCNAAGRGVDSIGVTDDGPPDLISEDDEDCEDDEADIAHMKRVTRKIIEGEMDSNGVRQWLLTDNSSTAKKFSKSTFEAGLPTQMVCTEHEPTVLSYMLTPLSL